MSAPESPRLDADAVRFESLTRTEKGIDLKVSDDPDNGVILGMAQAMIELLGDAKNYVECEVTPSLGSGITGAYTMTVQRRNHPTAHELRMKAEQERDDLQARWDARDTALRALIEQWRAEADNRQMGGLHDRGYASAMLIVAAELERAMGDRP